MSLQSTETESRYNQLSAVFIPAVRSMKKQYLKETLYTVLLLAAATGISFGFFYLGNKNIANITVTYTLALILTALYTSGYLYGIIASLFCVIAVNYFFS